MPRVGLQSSFKIKATFESLHPTPFSVFIVAVWEFLSSMVELFGCRKSLELAGIRIANNKEQAAI